MIQTQQRSFEDHLDEAIQDPNEAAAYLLAAVEENDHAYLIQVIQRLSKIWNINDLTQADAQRMVIGLTQFNDLIHQLGLTINIAAKN